MRRLLFLIAVTAVASPAHAITHMSQSQVKELSIALVEEVKTKIGENKKDIALAECVAMREAVLRKFPRPPDELVSLIKGACQPLFEEVKVPAESAKAALEKYGEQIAEMSFMMTVGPLGGGYDGSRKDIERIVAASKMEVEAFKLATDFVALLPRPQLDDEVAKTGVDTSQLQLRRLELWNLIWGATFAAEMITQKIVPQLAATVQTHEGAASGSDRMTVLAAEGAVEEAADLLRKAAPDSAEMKQAEALLGKIRARIEVLYRKEVENERMPADRYKGADRKALEAIVKKALSERYRGVLRIVINFDGWTAPETIAWWDDRNAIHWSRTKSIPGGHAAVETKEKGLAQYRVIPFSFSQSWDWATHQFLPTRVSIGGWGPPIMKKNIAK